MHIFYFQSSSPCLPELSLRIHPECENSSFFQKTRKHSSERIRLIFVGDNHKYQTARPYESLKPVGIWKNNPVLKKKKKCKADSIAHLGKHNLFVLSMAHASCNTFKTSIHAMRISGFWNKSHGLCFLSICLCAKKTDEI